MFRHFLVPVAGDDLSPKAMKASVELARALGASITGLIIEPPTPELASGQAAIHYVNEWEAHERAFSVHAEAVMAAFAAMADKAGVPFQAMRGGSIPVADAVIEAARRLECDLVVMVTHGRSGLGELLHGSATKSVLSRSKLPLLVLH